MIDFPNILLARGDDGWVGILFFLVPFILWAIGTIAQKMNQKQAEERRRRLREMMEQPPAPTSARQRPAPPPMRPTRAGPMPVPPRRPAPPPLPPKRQPKGKFPVRLPREEVIILPETPIKASQQARSIRADEMVTVKPKAAKALTIHQWLTPATLRQQFILTELFQPPLALRPPRDEQL